MSRKSPEPKPAPISEAAEKAGLLIRDLQNRLEGKAEPENLEWELQKCFALEATGQTRLSMDQIRTRVVDRVAAKVLNEWESSALENEVVDRLVELVYERLMAARPELRERNRLSGAA